MTPPHIDFYNYLTSSRSFRHQSLVEKEQFSEIWQLFTFYVCVVVGFFVLLFFVLF